MTAVQKSHYHVLGLTGSATTSYGLEDIKAAYKRALLRHHPDKATDNAAVSQISVDDITRAFKLLSDPSSRAAYDREQALLQTRQQQRPWADGTAEREGSTFNNGLETVDLDDMLLREQDGSNQEQELDVWTRQCRCGRLYTVSEAQLEAESARGEIYLPCDGCSLWLRVLFQAAED